MPETQTPPVEEPQIESFLDRMRSMGDELPAAPPTIPEPAEATPEPTEAAKEPTEEKETKEKKAGTPLEKVNELPDKDDASPTTPLDKLGKLGGKPTAEEPADTPEEGESEAPDAEKSGEEEPEGPAHRRFKALKEENRSIKQTLADIESERDQTQQRFEEAEARLKEFEGMSKEMDRFKQERSVLQLEQTDQFVETVTEPLKSIMGEAYKVGDSYSDVGLKDQEIADVLGIDDRRARNKGIRELQEKYDIDPEDKDTLVELGAQIIPIMRQREKLFENADSALLELKERQDQKKQQQLVLQVEERKEAAEQVVRKIQTKLPFLSAVDGVDFSQLQQEVADTGFDALDSHNKVYSQLAGNLLPDMARAHVELQEAYDALADELEELKGAAPAAGGAGTATGSTEPSGKDGKSFLDRLGSGEMFGG